MPLTPGTRLGRYEIRSKLGEGGMGEVYLARDPKLNRDVAIKVLPAHFSTDADRLRRFEQEAQAAGALNHPNILAIYDVETHEGSPYVVSELLEGETLRERMSGAPLPLRKSLDYAAQVARGLSAAHARGIVHRDLKPENLFVTRDGRVKILDFGIAKLVEPNDGGARIDAPTRRMDTAPGTVVGTVGYMSPEQVRGARVDQRTDFFSFGCVFYEMLAGRRAFVRATAADTLSAILREDPPDLSEAEKPVPPAVARVVRRCLEKSAQERFQSASDLAFDLENLSGASGATEARNAQTVAAEGAPARRKPSWLVFAGVGLAVVVAASLFAGFLAGKRVGRTPPPAFRQLTFRRGSIWSARFAPDGHTILYGAALEGSPVQIYTTRPESPESSPLGLPDGSVLSVSSLGELAVLLGADAGGAYTFTVGTLARAPLAGGAPRPVLEDVAFADWSPDGKGLAAVHRVGGRWRLEYPIGKVLYETDGHISFPRFSPKGDLIAFMDHPQPSDDRGTVAVVDLDGRKRTLTSEMGSEQGIAWSPEGEEIWFAGIVDANTRVLQAVTLAGRRRVVVASPGDLTLQDISRDGRVLLTRGGAVGGILGVAPGETKERDLSWLDFSEVYDLSADGKTILFAEEGGAVGDRYGVYLRQTDGRPAVRLGDGIPFSLSPDGKWAASTLVTVPAPLVLLPLGAGEPRRFTGETISYLGAEWFPDSKRILVQGKESGHDTRSYAQDLAGGAPRPLTPEGTTLRLISPDGKLALTHDADHKVAIYSFDNGATRPLPGVAEGETAIRWSADGRSLYVASTQGISAKIYRVDVSDGRRELWKELKPSEPSGVTSVSKIVITPDARSYFYTYGRRLTDLFLVEGVK
ncbi:MAG: protein kinase domain-containing protein [Pyrinomonadaceae bacterium]